MIIINENKKDIEELQDIVTKKKENTKKEEKNKNLTQKIWDGTKWILGKGVDTLYTPIRHLGTTAREGALGGIGEQIGKEFEQITNQKIPEFKQKLLDVLLKQTPHELTELKKFLDKLIQNPNALTQKEIKQAYEYADLIRKDDYQFLQPFKTIVDKETLQNCRNTLFPSLRSFFKNPLLAQKKEAEEMLKELSRIFDTLLAPLNKNKGALIESVNHLQTSLLSETGKFFELLKEKGFEGDESAMKLLFGQLEGLFGPFFYPLIGRYRSEEASRRGFSNTGPQRN